MPDERLTPRQRDVFDAVAHHLAAHGYSPTVREICEVLGITSPGTVHAHLNALVEGGWLQREDRKPRTLRVLRLPT